MGKKLRFVFAREFRAILNETKFEPLDAFMDFDQFRGGLARNVACIARRSARRGAPGNSATAKAYCETAADRRRFAIAEAKARIAPGRLNAASGAIGRRPTHCPPGQKAAPSLLFSKSIKIARQEPGNGIAKPRRKSRYRFVCVAAARADVHFYFCFGRNLLSIGGNGLNGDFCRFLRS